MATASVPSSVNSSPSIQGLAAAEEKVTMPQPKHGYPSSLTVDFRKLSDESLRTYIARYRLNVRGEATHYELATAVAQHFEGVFVDEEVVLGRFFECLDRASTTHEQDYNADSDEEDESLARVGEQVAAKVTMIDENGSWILASVVSYNKQTDSYQVQDEDEATTKILDLPASRIRRLYDEDSEAHDLQKGDRVLAIFPETTSFYRAVISKTPKRNANGSVSEVVLKFEDDEDDAGRTPHRRVNIRYVLREQRPSASSRNNSRSSAFINANQGGSGGGPPPPPPPQPPSSYGGGGGGGGGPPPPPPSAPPGGSNNQNNGGDSSSPPPPPSAARDEPGATSTRGEQAEGGSSTYSDMIAAALEKLPGRLGVFKDICSIIEADFSAHLNWKLESDVRKTPVWKSSVRKILFSNPRFSNNVTDDKQVFGFAEKSLPTQNGSIQDTAAQLPSSVPAQQPNPATAGASTTSSSSQQQYSTFKPLNSLPVQAAS